MVNMYSMGMMGGMYGMYGMYNTYDSMGGNSHQQLTARDGVGYEDFGSAPYAQPYPFAIVSRRPEPACLENPICRFFKKCFKSG